MDMHGRIVNAENYHEQRASWKLDLGLPVGTSVELFLFIDSPDRVNDSEPGGL